MYWTQVSGRLGSGREQLNLVESISGALQRVSNNLRSPSGGGGNSLAWQLGSLPDWACSPCSMACCYS